MKPFLGASRMLLKMGKEHQELKPVIWHQSLRGDWRWETGQQPAEHLTRQEQCSRSSGPQRGISPNQLHLKMGTVRISCTTTVSKGRCDWIGLLQALVT